MDFHFDNIGNRGFPYYRDKAAQILARYSGTEPGREGWELLFSCIDHTSLNSFDHEEGIRIFCRKVLDLGNRHIPKGQVAGVCVYPVFASVVAEELKGSGIRTACVAGAFPTGLSPLEIRLQEAVYAIEHGAGEIDMVITRGKLMSGVFQDVYEEVASFREKCGSHTLKVILETGDLDSAGLIARACEIALEAGADFIKTSTGKGKQGYTEEAWLVILDCVHEFYNKTGKKVGVKASGGIAEPGVAMNCLLLTREILGDEWLNPGLFRIGASRLTETIDKKYLAPFT